MDNHYEQKYVILHNEQNDGQHVVFEDEEEEMMKLEPSTSEEVECDVEDPYFLERELMEKVNRDHNVCFHCNATLASKRFYNHLFDNHNYTRDQLEAMKAQKRFDKSNKDKSKKKIIYECECGNQYISQSGLARHKIKMHGTDRETAMPSVTTTDKIVCPSYGCLTNFNTYMDLAIHVDSNHRRLNLIPDAYRIRRVMLEDKSAFLSWKRLMERDTNSEFFLRTTQKVQFAERTMLYKCHFSNSRGHEKGTRCEQCPSFIRACVRTTGRYEVVACFGHLGHEHDTETSEAKLMRLRKWSIRRGDPEHLNPPVLSAENQQSTSNGGDIDQIIDDEGNMIVTEEVVEEEQVIDEGDMIGIEEEVEIVAEEADEKILKPHRVFRGY